mgnify:CR=1 FL=1
MNIVFWGETHRSGTTANYTAMAGIAALMPGQEDCVRQPAEGAMRGFGTLFVGCGSVQSGGSKEAPFDSGSCGGKF